MTRPEIITALAKAIYCHDGTLSTPWDCEGDRWEREWVLMRLNAESQAAAVLELVGPKPLVWQDRDVRYWAAETVSRTAYITEYRGMDQPFKLDARDYSNRMSHHPTLEAAQAAAQALADAAHWANTKLGDCRAAT